MKKTLILTSVLALTACSTVHNKGINGSVIPNTDVEVRPLETSIHVGEHVKGASTCTKLLGITLSGPEKESYGATLQTSAGNIADGECTRGAIYNALHGTEADLILAPQYEVEGSRVLCIPFTDLCLYKTATIVVKGFAGRYGQIKEMSPEVVKARQLSNKKTETAGSAKGFLF